MGEEGVTQSKLMEDNSALKTRIAELEQSEQLLRGSESRYQLLFNSSLDAIAILGGNPPRLLHVNPAFLHLFGYTLQELLAFSATDMFMLVHPDDQELVRSRLQRRLQGEEVPQLYEFRIVTKDGQTRWVEVSASSFSNNDQLFSQAIYRDITERKRTESALRKSEENYRSLASTADSLFILDHNYRMIFANEYLLRRVRPHVSGPIIGESIDDIFHSSQTMPMRKGVDTVLATGQHYYDEQWGHYSRTYFVRTFSPIFDETGNVINVTIASKDMTKYKLTEIALRESEEKYRALASTMDAVFLVDEERRYLFANDNYLNSHRAPLIGRRYDELHDQGDTQRFATAVAYVIETGLPYQDEHFGKFVGRYWLRTFSPVKNDEGRITAVAVSAKDIQERKQAEEILRESEAKYHALASTVDYLTLVDRDCRYLFANESYLNLFAREGIEIISRPYHEMHDQETTRAFAAAVRYVIETGKDYQDEWLGKRSAKYLLRTFSPVRDAQGRISAVTVAMKDITDRRRAEEKARQQEIQLRTIIESTDDGILAVDSAGKVIIANKRAAQIWEIPPELLREESDEARLAYALTKVVNPDELFKKVQRLYTSSTVDFDTIHFKNGRIVERYSCPMLQDGNVVGRVWSFRDVTERRQAEDSLQQSEEKYRSLATTVDRLVLVDRNCTILFANDSFTKRFDKGESVIGKAFSSLHTQEAAQAFAKSVARVFDTAEALQDDWPSTRRKRHWLRTFTPVKDRAGNIFAVTVSYKDITEIKRVEKELMDALKEKDLLLREVHHRVKNNMQVISSLLKLQAASIKNQEMATVFERSQRRIQSMALIHEQLYRVGDFSRISLADYTQDLARMLMSAYTSDPAKIALVVEGQDVYVGINNAIPCGLILNELITNSLKYAFPADKRGELRITIAETKQRETLIVVSDNGIGLPDSVDPDQPQGIGLYLVSGLVKNQLGGQLEVQRHNGTEFRLTFPA